MEGLDLAMFDGQILALLGHNGAGKSTTINMRRGLPSHKSFSGLPGPVNPLSKSRGGFSTKTRTEKGRHGFAPGG